MRLLFVVKDLISYVNALNDPQYLAFTGFQSSDFEGNVFLGAIRVIHDIDKLLDILQPTNLKETK